MAFTKTVQPPPKTVTIQDLANSRIVLRLSGDPAEVLLEFDDGSNFGVMVPLDFLTTGQASNLEQLKLAIRRRAALTVFGMTETP